MRAKRRKPDLKEITWEEETPNQGGEYRPERSPLFNSLDRYRQAQIEAYQHWIRMREVIRVVPQPTRITPLEPTPEQRRVRRYGWYRDLENNYTRNRQRYGD